MEIVRKVVFEVNGKQYDSQKAAIKAAENMSYDFFRNMCIKHGLEMKKFAAFYDEMLANKDKVIDMLNIEYEWDD